MNFSEKLQKLRKENKLSQEQLADMLDVTRQSVSKWESGTTYPEMDKLITMCKIFKCSLDDLTNDEITDIKIETKKSNQFNNVLDSVLEIIEKTVRMFKIMSFKETLKCLFSLFILGMFLLLLRIPFEMLEQGFYNIVCNLNRPVVESFLSGTFNFILDIIYFVLYALAFIYIYKIAYLDKYEFVKPDKNKENTAAEKIIIEEKKENISPKEIKIVTKQRENGNTIFTILWKIVLGFIKFLVICFIIPIIFIILVLFALLAIDISLMIKGVIYIGIFLGIIFVIVMSIMILELAIEFIFNKSVAFKRLLWTFIISLGGIGLSCGILALEISNTEYIDELPSTINLKTISAEYTMNSNLSIDNDIDFYDGYYHYSYYTRVEYVVDETLNNTVKLEASFDADFVDVAFIKSDEMIGINKIEKSEPEQIKYILDLVIENLKKKKIYDYDDVQFVILKVYSSSANIETIKTNVKNIEAEELEKYRQDELNQREEYYNSQINEYEYQIDDYENRISDYEEQISILEDENEILKDKLQEYKDKINDLIDE